MSDQPYCLKNVFKVWFQAICTMPRQKNASQKAEEAKRKAENDCIVRQKLKLLTMVHEYPILYDKGHPNHLNADMKMVIWENIATQLRETGKTVHFIDKYEISVIYLHSTIGFVVMVDIVRPA